MLNLDLADRLEFHEETGNAELAIAIGGEVWERGDALLIGTQPEMGAGLNFACRLRSDAASVEKTVDDVCEWFTRRGLAPHFRISPLTRPANLAQILGRRGFVQTEAETQMVHEDQDTEPLANPRVIVEPIKSKEIERWAEIQHRGFGGGGAPSPLAVHVAQATAASPGNTLYLAYLDGDASGVGVLIEWAGVFGIYGVATLLEARGQGVGTALMRRMIGDVRARSDAPLCLQAETDSPTQRWYERLGFRVVYDRTGWTLENRSKGESEK